MKIEDIQQELNDVSQAVAAHAEKFNSIEKLHSDCKQLQKERLDNTSLSIAKIEKNISLHQEKILDEIDRLKKEDIAINSNVNVLAGNVKDLVDYRNKIDQRISKLIITILASLVVALLVKSVDRYFEMKETADKYNHLMSSRDQVEHIKLTPKEVQSNGSNSSRKPVN